MTASGSLLSTRQSIRNEPSSFVPVRFLRFEFREDGVALPVGGAGMSVMQHIRAVDHKGRVTRLQRNLRTEVSAPGLYEISFEDIDTDQFLPIPPRRVDVRAGETTDVIVELQRK